MGEHTYMCYSIQLHDPFELLVGDYLSMPQGKGGYHTIGLYLDTYSQQVWAFKYI